MHFVLLADSASSLFVFVHGCVKFSHQPRSTSATTESSSWLVENVAQIFSLVTQPLHRRYAERFSAAP